MVRNNNIIHNVHFHKQWQRKIKCHFNQPAKKKKRHEKRKQKAEHIAPRPLKKLRPIVRCPTARYNIKQRLGRGFTADELKAVKISPHYARTIGIAVDKRRRNKSVEGLQLNIQRLKEYMSKLIVFPKKPKKKDEKIREAIKAAVQYKGVIMPVKTPFGVAVEEPRVITQAEREFSARKALQTARSSVIYRTRRERKRKYKAEEKAERDKKAAKKK